MQHTLFYDSTLTGLDKVNLLSVLHVIVNDVHTPEHKAQHVVKFSEKKGVPCPNVKLGNKQSIEGLAQCVRFVGRVYQMHSNDPIEATFIDSFVDLGLNSLGDKATIVTHAENLNIHLAMRTYLSGYDITIADVAVWCGLINNPRWSALQKEKDKYQHLIRWFKHLESLPGVSDCISTGKEKVAESKEAASVLADAGGSFEIGIKGDNVCTRFPPEPSGYMHIGHAKAALLNDIIAKTNKGKCIVRFDDTNPSKEKDEYVQSIIEDLEVLGLEYVKPITHTSDYFDLMQSLCTKMIEEGNAYVDDTDVETMRSERMACINSKNRDNPISQNLQLWEEMKAASAVGLTCSVRAKIDMQSRNGALRDPVIYRCNLQPHHRTGSKYKIYPTYDFACPIVDSIEGVTHALRTSEYNDRNDQYYWVLDALKMRKPKIEDYSRLNMVYTLMSKRKLTWFVNEGFVNGWDDPRLPTVRGMLRRGLEVEALRRFIMDQGFSKNTNLMGWDKLWNFNKKIIDPIAHRYTVVTANEKIPFVLQDLGSSWEELVDLDLHPKNKEVGVKKLLRSGKIYLEKVDAEDISENEEVTLIGWGNAIVSNIIRDASGQVTGLQGRTNLSGSVKTTKKKLTWIAVSPKKAEIDEIKSSVEVSVDPIVVTLVDLDFLITVPSMEEGMEFEKVLRPKNETWKETKVYGEFSLRNVKKGQTIQINRRGFYKCDRAYTSNESPAVFFFIPDGRSKGASKLTE